MHFDIKSYLKNTRNHTAKQALNKLTRQCMVRQIHFTWQEKKPMN